MAWHVIADACPAGQKPSNTAYAIAWQAGLGLTQQHHQRHLPLQGRAEAGEASEEDADAQELADDDPMQYAPRPEALLPHDQATSTTTASLQQDKALANGKAPVYRPPKIAPASMQQDGQEDPDRERGKRDRRAREDGARRAARSDVIQSLAAEVAGAPDEVSCV